MRNILLCSLFVLLVSITGGAKPVHHYVYFGMDREKLKDATTFLEMKNFEGAQIAYSWRQLEPGKDEYDFSLIREDLAFLSSKGKKLFVQIQDVSFSEKGIHVPRYLVRDPQYGGGADKQYTYKFVDDRETDVKVLGWMARRWDEKVRERFKNLLVELGKEFDGKIEGVNLAETAFDIGRSGALFPKDFTYEKYRDGVIANMKAMREAFPKSVVLVYANFLPGDGNLRAVYDAARKLRVGVGGPDLLPYKEWQMKSSYPLIRASSDQVAVGVAVQDGNYAHVNPRTGKQVTIDEIIKFGKEYLGVDYIFWCTEEPYYSEQLVPFLKEGSKSHENTLPPPGHPRRDSPGFTTHSISNDARAGSKTLLHILIQQQRVGIFWNGRYRVFACAVGIRFLGRSKTWNAAFVGLCRVQFGSRSFPGAPAVPALPRTHAR